MKLVLESLSWNRTLRLRAESFGSTTFRSGYRAPLRVLS